MVSRINVKKNNFLPEHKASPIITTFKMDLIQVHAMREYWITEN